MLKISRSFENHFQIFRLILKLEFDDRVIVISDIFLTLKHFNTLPKKQKKKLYDKTIEIYDMIL